jgi:cytochrome c oxidase subunit 1
MSTTLLSATLPPRTRPRVTRLLLTTDHKKIGLLTMGTAMVLFLVFGALALTMRADLASPREALISTHLYNQLFTIHGSGMIYFVITPLALGLGIYLVPLQVGAPGIAFPRMAQLAYWIYVIAAVIMLSGFLTAGGAGNDGWYSYLPLSSALNSPGKGVDLWVAGAFLAGVFALMMSICVLWTALRMRAPRMSLLRMPVFTWSEVVTCLMGIAAFPSLIGAMCMIVTARIDPAAFTGDLPNLNYQNLFWFYGHPVVYIMFFPFVGCVAEVLQTFGQRRYVGYKVTVLSLLVFAALSMAVWGHHMFTTGQESNEYFSATSTALSVPAGLEYFGFLATIIGSRLRYSTAMLFALAFIPQFLVGGLTGIMLAAPTLDYHFHGSYFVVAHFHYTLFAGSVFGFFAGFYYWFPKATGRMLSERLGKAHFWVMVIGTNVTFLPMFIAGFEGLPRRVAHYPASFHTLNIVSSIGAGILGLSMLLLVVNVGEALRKRRPAPDDPWDGMTLEWATTSPPPEFNFPRGIPPIKSYTPLLDWKESRRERLSEPEVVP